MKYNLRNIRIVYLLMSLSIGFAVYSLLKSSDKKSDSTLIETAPNNTFGEHNVLQVRKDTLKMLIEKTFPYSLLIKEDNTELKVEIKGAKQKAFSFYNGNDALLKFSLDEFGFEIRHDKNQDILSAKFKIENKGASVPNDVMINLTKLYVDLKK